jgi:Flp pilus assembly pilin Flp
MVFFPLRQSNQAIMMMTHFYILKDLLSDRRGLTALEYGLIASVIFGIIFAGFTQMASALSHTFSNVGVSL